MLDLEVAGAKYLGKRIDKFPEVSSRMLIRSLQRVLVNI